MKKNIYYYMINDIIEHINVTQITFNLKNINEIKYDELTLQFIDIEKEININVDKISFYLSLLTLIDEQFIYNFNKHLYIKNLINYLEKNIDIYYNNSKKNILIKKNIKKNLGNECDKYIIQFISNLFNINIYVIHDNNNIEKYFHPILNKNIKSIIFYEKSSIYYPIINSDKNIIDYLFNK